MHAHAAHTSYGGQVLSKSLWERRNKSQGGPKATAPLKVLPKQHKLKITLAVMHLATVPPPPLGRPKGGGVGVGIVL